MIHHFFILVLFFTYNMHALFSHDRVAHRMQKGNIDEAKKMLMDMIVECPDNPELLYDMSVASYKTHDFKQALSYAKQAAHVPNAHASLKEQAYFNAGNAAVQLKQLEDAIEFYQQVLKINPENKRAKHNLAKVKEMLNQQQQQENKKQDKEKDQNEKKDDQDQNKKDQSEENQDQKNKDQKNQNQKDSQSENKQSQDKNTQDQEKNKDKQNQDKESKEQSEKDRKSEQKKQKEKEEKQRQQAKQKAAEEKEAQEHNEVEQPDKEQKLEPYLARLLQEQEKKDAEMNKRMVKAAVNDELAGRDGQNNW